jgi:hypothetical protein
VTNGYDAWFQSIRLHAAEPSAWSICADRLRQAAADLWDAGNEHDRNPGSEIGATLLVHHTTPGFERPLTGGSTFDVCVMLFGFGLENLVKGIIVCCSPSRVLESELRKWTGGGHNLNALLISSGITLSDAEERVIDRTSRAVTWKGRYPVPLRFEEVDGTDAITGRVGISNIWPADDYAALVAVFDRCRHILVDVMGKIPPLPLDHDFRAHSG